VAYAGGVRTDDGRVGYIAVGVGLLAFGVISIFSIGYPLISFGIAHLALYRVRHRRSIRLPIMWGLAAFWIGFILVGPMWCTHSDVTGTGEVWCRSLLGARYPEANPSFTPGLVAGALAALGTAFVVRTHIKWSARPTE
jgi:hypothetical protein